jgi:glucosamine-phosphate N-acetyltransferase
MRNQIKVTKIKKEHMSAVIDMLQELSEFSPPDIEYEDIWALFDSQPNVFGVVALDEHVVVGYGAVVIETKIRGGKVGHIEDIVTHKDFRKHGIGNAVLQKLFEIASLEYCYKLTLQCKDHNVRFYEKNNYCVSGQALQQFLQS